MPKKRLDNDKRLVAFENVEKKRGKGEEREEGYLRSNKVTDG